MATPPNPNRLAHPQPGHDAPTLAHLLNLPNFLTLCRLGLIPIFLSLLARHHYTYALYVFVAAAVTDGLDGTVARWFDSRTELGAFLDPFADKLMLLSAFVLLTINGEFPVWLFSVVVIRDVIIVVGYLMVSFFIDERIPVRPTYLGKISTFLQIACVIGALVGLEIRSVEYWDALLYATVAVTVLAGGQYMYRGLVILRSNEPEMFA
jgi:cardiolipin synthase (CMP-forming)